MSSEQVKQIDAVVNWSVKIIMGLCAFALAAMYYSAKDDIHFLMQKSGAADTRLMRIETQLEDRVKADDRRDRAIEEIQRTLNERRR